MSDSFEVELARLVRVLRDGVPPWEAGLATARTLLARLIEADDAARHVVTAPPAVPPEALPSALIAAAHDARTAGVDLERFANDVADARRSCT